MGPKTRTRIEEVPIRDGIILALRGTGGVFTKSSEATARAVSRAVLEAERSGASITDAINKLVRDAVNGLSEFREDTAAAIQGITVGVFRGTREFGPAARRTLFRVSRSIIQETIKLRGDLHQAFRGLVKGAIHSARDLGMDQPAAASAAAAYALDAAEELHPAAAGQIRAAGAVAIDGVRFEFHGSTRELSPS